MNNYMNPYLNMYMQPNPYNASYQVAPQQMQVTKVSGENGARSYQMGPNSSALLLDESGMMVWLCTTDGASYKTVSAYDIVPHKAEPEPDFGSLEDRIKRLEEIVNGNPADTATVRKKPSKPDPVAD